MFFISKSYMKHGCIYNQPKAADHMSHIVYGHIVLGRCCSNVLPVDVIVTGINLKHWRFTFNIALC